MGPQRGVVVEQARGGQEVDYLEGAATEGVLGVMKR